MLCTLANHWLEVAGRDTQAKCNLSPQTILFLTGIHTSLLGAILLVGSSQDRDTKEILVITLSQKWDRYRHHGTEVFLTWHRTIVEECLWDHLPRWLQLRLGAIDLRRLLACLTICGNLQVREDSSLLLSLPRHLLCRLVHCLRHTLTTPLGTHIFPCLHYHHLTDEEDGVQ